MFSIGQAYHQISISVKLRGIEVQKLISQHFNNKTKFLLFFRSTSIQFISKILTHRPMVIYKHWLRLQRYREFDVPPTTSLLAAKTSSMLLLPLIRRRVPFRKGSPFKEVQRRAQFEKDRHPKKRCIRRRAQFDEELNSKKSSNRRIDQSKKNSENQRWQSWRWH